MTEIEMSGLLERQLAALQNAGCDMSLDLSAFEAGEWLLAFEGVYVEHHRHPGLLSSDEVSALAQYFGDEAKLDDLIQVSG